MRVFAYARPRAPLLRPLLYHAGRVREIGDREKARDIVIDTSDVGGAHSTHKKGLK